MILLVHLFPRGIEEALQVLLVDIVKATIVNCLIGSILAVALGGFKLLFQFFGITMHLNFHDDQFRQLFLDIECQVVVPTAHHVGALRRLCSETAISAG